MVVLGESIRGTDEIETLVRRTELVEIGGEFFRHRIIRLLRMQRIRDRTLHWFVVLRKRPVGKCGEWSKDTTDTLGIHDERSHVIRWLRIDLEIGNVVTDPLLLRFVPPNLPSLRIPRFS